MKIAEFHEFFVSPNVKSTPKDGQSNKGIRTAWREDKRRDAEGRQRAYDELLANGPDELRPYRDRSVRPRLGRKMREADQ